MVTGDFDTWLPNQTLKKHNKQQILQSQSGSTCPFPKRITNTYKFATAKTRVQFNFRKRHIILTRTMNSMKLCLSPLVPPMTVVSRKMFLMFLPAICSKWPLLQPAYERHGPTIGRAPDR